MIGSDMFGRKEEHSPQVLIIEDNESDLAMVRALLEGIDGTAWEDLIRIGGRTLLREVIVLFLKQAPVRLNAAREALKNADVRFAGDELHSLKSSCANLGLRAMRDLCERGEAASLKKIPEILKDLETEFDRIRAWLEKQVKRLGEAT